MAHGTRRPNDRFWSSVDFASFASLSVFARNIFRKVVAKTPSPAVRLRTLLVLALSISAFSQTPATRAAAVLNEYCVTCHNADLATAGLILNTADLHPAANPEQWEKVILKLRAQSMPPAGMPRPDQSGYTAALTFLETELDRSAAAKPNPGKLPPVHRLSRTEYQNSIRDLLALDALPREMDYPVLLPADNTSSGFDNIADLLFVSPTVIERYLDAATKISRLAVGDPKQPVQVNIYRMSPELPQDSRVEELPLGTRGGIAIHSDFPLDGTYTIKVETAGAARDPHELEITVDGARVETQTLGGAAGGRGGRGGATAKPPEFRIPVKAGPRLIGITFVEHTEARDEATLRPRMRSTGTLPAISRVTISGPFDATGPGDTPSRRRIFVCHPTSAAQEPACARQIISTLARRAYRRPVTDEDLTRLMPFYRAESDFDHGIQKALERLLVSPNFLFRIERDPANATPGSVHRLSDLELASRLSFFLWSSIPDDELLDLAIANKLHEPATLDQQTRRMLADPRSESMVTNFAEQWLFLRDLEAKQPDEILFPEFDETLRSAFRRETELFLNSVLRENRSVLDLLTANYTFVNERLARHYGIPNIQGSHFRRVTLPANSPRGGLLGQGSVLTITSYANRTSAVLRGKWVLENLLSSPPPPPPPNVPAFNADAGEPGKVLTMREAMTRHRADPACAGCHARMDPIGFAMENFDADGKYRDRDAGGPIDASGTFPDGAKFDGMAGLKAALLKHPDEFVDTVAEKLLMYALGRNLQYYDQPAVRAIAAEAAKQNNTLSSLVLAIVKNPAFQTRESAR